MVQEASILNHAVVSVLDLQFNNNLTSSVVKTDPLEQKESKNSQFPENVSEADRLQLIRKTLMYFTSKLAELGKAKFLSEDEIGSYSYLSVQDCFNIKWSVGYQGREIITYAGLWAEKSPITVDHAIAYLNIKSNFKPDPKISQVTQIKADKRESLTKNWECITSYIQQGIATLDEVFRIKEVFNLSANTHRDQWIRGGILKLKEYCDLERVYGGWQFMEDQWKNRQKNKKNPLTRNEVEKDLQRFWKDYYQKQETELAKRKAAERINPTESTHTASVHQTVSESACRLKNCYGEKLQDGKKLSQILQELRNALKDIALKDIQESDEKNDPTAGINAQRMIMIPDALKAIDMIEKEAEGAEAFRDVGSGLTLSELLAYCFLAFEDNVRRKGDRLDALLALVEGLHHLSTSKEGKAVCPGGQFNALIELGVGYHDDFQIKYITNDLIVAQLSLIVKKKVKAFVSELSDVDYKQKVLKKLDEQGVIPIWNDIKDSVKNSLYSAFSEDAPPEEKVDEDEKAPISIRKIDPLTQYKLDTALENVEYIDISSVLEQFDTSIGSSNFRSGPP